MADSFSATLLLQRTSPCLHASRHLHLSLKCLLEKLRTSVRLKQPILTKFCTCVISREFDEPVQFSFRSKNFTDLSTQGHKRISSAYILIVWVGYLTTLTLQGLHIVDDVIVSVCGAMDGMRIGRGNRSTWRNPAPLSLCLPKIPYDLVWNRTLAAAVGYNAVLSGAC
jgi:hypothetical protein